MIHSNDESTKLHHQRHHHTHVLSSDVRPHHGLTLSLWCVCERVFVCSSPCALRFAYPMIYPPGYVHTYTYYYVTIEWRINRRAYFNPIFGCCIIPHSIRLHPPATYTLCEFSPKYLLCTYYPPIYMSIYKTSIYQPIYVPLYMIVMRVAAATALMTDWQFE